LLKEAYGIDDSQILHAPSLLDSRSFTITATIDHAVFEEISLLSADEQEAAHQHMLQQLLADRFQFVGRQETRDLPIYLLVRSGSALHLLEANNSSYDDGARWGDGTPMGPHVVSWEFRFGHVHMIGQAASINQLVERWAQKITPQLGRKVVNNTGLTGRYDFDLSFRMPWPPNGTLFPDTDTDLQNNADPAEAALSSDDLFAALRKQLGLELKSSVGPVRVLTVERLELPSDN
jgi:bla regulator protein blaR1